MFDGIDSTDKSKQLRRNKFLPAMYLGQSDFAMPKDNLSNPRVKIA